MRIFDKEDLLKLYRPPNNSHKGQNGRVLVIGGSKLFHSSIFWSADVASRWVDLVHFTSPANENNDVVRTKIKAGFWSGIVVDWGDVDSYVEEDDCILIGPGMTRSTEVNLKTEDPSTAKNHTDSWHAQDDKSDLESLSDLSNSDMTETDNTREIVNRLLRKYPDKKWVVDGGALQEVDPKLLNGNMIVTPHHGEWERLVSKITNNQTPNIKQFQIINNQIQNVTQTLGEFSRGFDDVTILLKNVEGMDVVVKGDEVMAVEGGNEGLTKGGTGDVLAGLTAAFFCKNESVLAASAASYVVKKAADELYRERGTFYNAGDLVEAVGKVLGKII